MKKLLFIIIFFPSFVLAQGTGGDVSAGTSSSTSSEQSQSNSTNVEDSDTKRKTKSISDAKAKERERDKRKTKTSAQEKTQTDTKRLELEEEVNLMVLFKAIMSELEEAAKRGEIKGPSATGLRFCSLYSVPVFTQTYNNAAWHNLEQQNVLMSYMSALQANRLYFCALSYHAIAKDYVAVVTAKKYYKKESLLEDSAFIVADIVAKHNLYDATLGNLIKVAIEHTARGPITNYIQATINYCRSLDASHTYIEHIPCLAQLENTNSETVVSDRNAIDGKAYVRTAQGSVAINPAEMSFDFDTLVQMMSSTELDGHTYKVEVTNSSEDSLSIRKSKERSYNVSLTERSTKTFDLVYEKTKQHNVQTADNLATTLRVNTSSNTNSSVSNLAK